VPPSCSDLISGDSYNGGNDSVADGVAMEDDKIQPNSDQGTGRHQGRPTNEQPGSAHEEPRFGQRLMRAPSGEDTDAIDKSKRCGHPRDTEHID
jgi:hypothetical protein